MKKYLITSFFLLSAICSRAQSDSTLIRISILEKTVYNFQDNFRKSQSEFNIGVSILALGTAATIGGASLPDKTGLGQDNTKTKNAIIIGGGIATLVAAIILIDSHKYIGYAGRWHYDGTSVKYDLTGR